MICRGGGGGGVFVMAALQSTISQSTIMPLAHVIDCQTTSVLEPLLYFGAVLEEFTSQWRALQSVCVCVCTTVCPLS